MTSSVKSILEMMKAENLLRDSHLITRLAGFSDSLTYEGKVFDDYYFQLQERVEKLGRLKLATVIPDNQGDRYISELINSLDELYDQIQSIERAAINFQARLKDAEADTQLLSSEFEGWYILAANEALSEANTKLPNQNLKAIAHSEFSRLSGGASVNLNSLIEAVKVLLTQLKSKRDMAKEKFALGQKQSDASWSNNLPSMGINLTSRPGSMIQPSDLDDEDEVDEIPAYVSKFDNTVKEVTNTISNDEDDESEISPSLDPDDAIEEAISEEAPEERPIVKHGDPKPATIVSPEEALQLMNQHDAGLDEDETKPPVVIKNEPKEITVTPIAIEDVGVTTTVIHTPLNTTVHMTPPLDDVDDLDGIDVPTVAPVKHEEVVAPVQVPVQTRKRMMFEYDDE